MDRGLFYSELQSNGVAAAPYGVSVPDASYFVAVPADLSLGSQVTVTNLGGVNATYNYLGIWWGSVDAYNTISFMKMTYIKYHLLEYKQPRRVPRMAIKQFIHQIFISIFLIYPISIAS